MVDDDAIRSLLTRLARALPAGGTIIDRAAVVAAGADSEGVTTRSLAHGAKPRPRWRRRPLYAVSNETIMSNEANKPSVQQTREGSRNRTRRKAALHLSRPVEN
jgi:hypothetical protein